MAFVGHLAELAGPHEFRVQSLRRMCVSVPSAFPPPLTLSMGTGHVYAQFQVETDRTSAAAHLQPLLLLLASFQRLDFMNSVFMLRKPNLSLTRIRNAISGH